MDWALEACFHLSIGSEAPDVGKETTCGRNSESQHRWRVYTGHMHRCSRRGGALHCGQIPCSLCSMAEISWIPCSLCSVQSGAAGEAVPCETP